MTYSEAKRELRRLIEAEEPLIGAWQADTLKNDPMGRWADDVAAEGGGRAIPIPRRIKERAVELAADLPEEEAGRLLLWFYVELAELDR